MKFKLIASLLQLMSMLALVGCNEGDDPAKPPVIENFTPNQGLEGATVRITGSNFSKALPDVKVQFNGVIASVTSATETEIVTIVPNGATTGKLEVTIGGTRATNSSQDFVVTHMPGITSFSPASGYEGETVTITGNNFSVAPASNIVKFNGVVAIVTASSATSIVVTVPTGITSGKIEVTVDGNTSTSAGDFTVLFPPVITAFSPEGGMPAASTGFPGETVIIYGNQFSSTPAGNTVKFNDATTATVLEATTTQLTVQVPIGATTGKISVAVNGREAISENTFTVAATNVWSLIEGTLPDALLRTSAIAFVIGKKIYFGLGQNSSNQNMKDFWEYDTETGLFTQRKDFGGIARNGATGFSIGSKGYVAGGFNTGTPYNDLWEYDPSTDNWSQKNPFPGPARSGLISLSVGSKGYVGTGIVGGASPTYYGDFYEFDPTTGNWTQKADVGIGVAGRTSAARFVINSVAYVGGGSSNGARKDFWGFTPNAWQGVSDIPAGPGVGTGFSFSIGSKGFSQASTQLWMFDPSNGQWTRKADPLVTIPGIGVSVDNVGYVITGSSINKVFYKYIPN